MAIFFYCLDWHCAEKGFDMRDRSKLVRMTFITTIALAATAHAAEPSEPAKQLLPIIATAATVQVLPLLQQQQPERAKNAFGYRIERYHYAPFTIDERQLTIAQRMYLRRYYEMPSTGRYTLECLMSSVAVSTYSCTAGGQLSDRALQYVRLVLRSVIPPIAPLPGTQKPSDPARFAVLTIEVAQRTVDDNPPIGFAIDTAAVTPVLTGLVGADDYPPSALRDEQEGVMSLNCQAQRDGSVACLDWDFEPPAAKPYFASIAERVSWRARIAERLPDGRLSAGAQFKLRINFRIPR